MQCVCGTWCTSKIYLYQVLSKPESALMIGDACRKKYLEKKKRHVCKNVNKKLLIKVINKGEKDIDLELHQINTWLWLVSLGQELNLPPVDLTKEMDTIERTLIEQGCDITPALQRIIDICKFKRTKFYQKGERFENRTFKEHQILIAKHADLANEFALGYFTLWIEQATLDRNYTSTYKIYI